jgi:hypothetical protein
MMQVPHLLPRNPSLGHLAVEKEKLMLCSTEGVRTEPTLPEISIVQWLQ